MGNKRRASVAEPSDGSDAEVTRKVSKKNKTSGSVISPAGKDDDGNPFWEVSLSTYSDDCFQELMFCQSFPTSAEWEFLSTKTG